MKTDAPWLLIRLSCRNKRYLQLAILLFFITTTALSQTSRTISGKVTDAISQKPVQGASVVLKGTNTGASSAVDGTFSLKLPSGTMTGVLIVAHVGYEELSMTFGKDDLLIDAVLKPAANILSDVVVVGYGTQKKKDLTASLNVITAKDLEDRPVANAVQALQGAAPNLTIQQSATEPGSTININVRGVSTMVNSSPLILVDGVPGSLDLINPNDIESVTVLKDAASAAIYGSRSANGVILVTTKKGKKSRKPTVNYSGMFGSQMPTFQIKPVTGEEYMMLKNEALVNSGLDAQFSPQQIREQAVKGSSKWWMNEVIKGSALQHNHNLSVSGNAGKFTYLASGGYLDQNSLYSGPGYAYKRYNARTNLGAQFGNLKIGANIGYAHIDTKEHAYYSDWLLSTAARIPAIYPAKDSAGNYTLVPTASNNPLAQLDKGGRRLYNNDNLNMNFNLEYKVTKNLSAKAVYGTDRYYQKLDEFRKAIDYNPYAGGSDNISSRTKNDKRTYQNTVQAMLNYENTFSEVHSVKGMLGFESFGYKHIYNQTRAQYVDNNTGEFVKDSSQILTGENDTYPDRTDRNALNSFFGRFSYGYADKYLAEVSFRGDYSSRFAKGNRFGFFPSFSLGWRISQEDFMQTFKEHVGSLKLRASWGQLGNQNINSDYGYMNVYTTTANGYGFGNYIQPGSYFKVGNPAITWETGNTSNIGFDIEVLNNKLTVSYDYFHKMTKNILIELPAPGIYGTTPPYQNAGTVKNQGWELAANYKLKTGHVYHTFSMNVADNLNQIVDFKGVTSIKGGDVKFINKEGFPLGAYYGLQSNGLYQTLGDVKNGVKPYFVNTVNPGDIKYVDRNGDGKITNDDRYVMGNPFPRYTFGFNYSVTWKGFDASLFIQGVGKRNVYLRGEAVEAFHNNWDNVYQQHLDRWTPTNPGATYPRLSIGQASANNEIQSDYWMYNAVYARLKNIQIGYSLPMKILDKAKLQKCRIYLTGQNLLTWTKMDVGFDPEVTEYNSSMDQSNSNAISGRVYPVQKVLALGIDIRF